MIRVCVHPISVGKDVRETDSPMGADHVVGQAASLNLLDQVRAAHVEQLGGLDRRELRVHRDDGARERANADRCADYLLNKAPSLDYATDLAKGG